MKINDRLFSMERLPLYQHTHHPKMVLPLDLLLYFNEKFEYKIQVLKEINAKSKLYVSYSKLTAKKKQEKRCSIRDGVKNYHVDLVP